MMGIGGSKIRTLDLPGLSNQIFLVFISDVDAAFLVGAMPRREGMERKDLLAANVKIFKEQGNALDKFAKKNVKVLVGFPINLSHSLSLTCSFRVSE